MTPGQAQEVQANAIGALIAIVLILLVVLHGG